MTLEQDTYWCHRCIWVHIRACKPVLDFEAHITMSHVQLSLIQPNSPKWYKSTVICFCIEFPYISSRCISRHLPESTEAEGLPLQHFSDVVWTGLDQVKTYKCKYQGSSCNGDASDVYSGVATFQYRPEHRPSCLCCLLFFLSVSSGKYLDWERTSVFKHFPMHHILAIQPFHIL